MKTNLFILSIIFSFYSCGQKETNRDLLILNNQIKQVKDSLLVMNTFLINYSYTTRVKGGYWIDKKSRDGKLFFNGKRIVDLNELRMCFEPKHDSVYKDCIVNIRNHNEFKDLPLKHLERFLKLVLFLNHNNINGAYLNNEISTYVFAYKDSLIYDDEDRRMLVVEESVEHVDKLEEYLNEVKKYDEKNGVVLYNPY